MIHDAAHLQTPLRLKADLCVIGSGAGGSAAAMAAAEAGLRVIVLEAGPFLAPAHMSQREEAMLTQLYWESGARSTADRSVRIHQGRGVGGSTLHNLNLCKRIPTPVLRQWQRERGLQHLPPARWAALYEETERLLSVSAVPIEKRSRHNRLLAEGATELGWRHGGLLHNRTGCTESGFCEIGCAYDAKNNAAKVLLPRALDAHASVLAHCHAVNIDHDGGRVRGVDALAMSPSGEIRGPIRIDAAKVCLGASATGTAALLLRSRVPAPDGSTGDTLRVHPALVAAGDFDDPVEAWNGIPQTVECTEFLDFESAHAEGAQAAGDVTDRIWIVPAFGHPLGTATMLPGYGEAHREVMKRYAHLAPLVAMLHDRSVGTVRPNGDLGLRMDYWPHAADLAQLRAGLRSCVELLFAAGARRVLIPASHMLVIRNIGELKLLDDLPLEAGSIDVTAVHPMATVPMGDDPTVAATTTWPVSGSLTAPSSPPPLGSPPNCPSTPSVCTWAGPWRPRDEDTAGHGSDAAPVNLGHLAGADCPGPRHDTAGRGAPIFWFERGRASAAASGQ